MPSYINHWIVTRIPLSLSLSLFLSLSLSLSHTHTHTQSVTATPQPQFHSCSSTPEETLRLTSLFHVALAFLWVDDIFQNLYFSVHKIITRWLQVNGKIQKSINKEIISPLPTPLINNHCQHSVVFPSSLLIVYLDFYIVNIMVTGRPKIVWRFGMKCLIRNRRYKSSEIKCGSKKLIHWVQFSRKKIKYIIEDKLFSKLDMNYRYTVFAEA